MHALCERELERNGGCIVKASQVITRPCGHRDSLRTQSLPNACDLIKGVTYVASLSPYDVPKKARGGRVIRNAATVWLCLSGVVADSFHPPVTHGKISQDGTCVVQDKE
jgi:hypothetical protein